VAVQTAAFDVGDHFIHDANQFILGVYGGQNLNSDTCVHTFSSLFRWGRLRQNKKPWNTNWYSTAESISILRFVPTLALSKSGKVEGQYPPLSLLLQAPLNL
jgi:hypothetical protein